jgi:hypothetical protein
MRMVPLVHIVSRCLGGVCPANVALHPAKGAPVHRPSGMLFVCVTLLMGETDD